MEYFIGLTFHQSSIHYKKIDSFRSRFDSKYSVSKLLQMTLFPPFHIDFKNTRSKLYKEFIKYLHDEGYENYLMGNSNDRTVSINFREIKQE